MGSTEFEYPTRIIMEDEESASIKTFPNTRNRCCCFPTSSSFSTSTTSFWEKVRAADNDDHWWALPFKALKRLQDWSEIVAGPRWKTFIRRFNRQRNHHQTKFQYDPLSYALNFDDGAGQNGHLDEDPTNHFPDFSTRFAAIPVSARTSMDLGK